MGYIKEIKIGSGTANLIEPILYGTTNTAAGTQDKVVSISNFELVTGVTVAVKFTVTNTHTTPRLNVNSTGAKPIKYRGENLPSAATLTADRVYQFVYDGTNWELIGDLNAVTSITPGNGLINGTSGTSQTAITTSGTISIKNSGVTNAMLAGSIANDKLLNSSITIGDKSINLGGSATLAEIGISYPVTSVAGKTGTITADVLRAALGLSNAMHFLGVTITNVSSGTPNTTASVSIGGSNVTAAAGDVVLYNSAEYVWGNGKWNLLGDESSYALKSTTLSGYGITDAKIANGIITLGDNTITPLTSQYTTHLYVNATLDGATSNATTTNAATYIHLYDTSTKRETIQLKGTGGATVTAASGVITINSANDDTKNTAGSTNSTSKLYLIGAISQAANPTTNSYQYTYTNNGLLSATKLGLNASGTEKVHMEWNATDLSLDFIFD